MDAFEQVVASILQRKGYWTQTSVKVELTKQEKRAIGRPSSPRWELDVVGYRGVSNEILVVECKSYLDSYGVRASAFDGTDPEDAKRYKIFVEENLRTVVFARLTTQFVERGFCAPNPRVRLCLAAGKIYGDETILVQHFERNGWMLWTPSYLKGELEALRDSGYENFTAAVVVKLLLRGEAE